MDVETELRVLGAQALEDLYKSLVSAKGFILEQAPGVCQEIVKWQITKGVIAVTLWVLAALIIAAIAYAVRNIRCEADQERAPLIATCVVGCIVLSVTLGAAVIPMSVDAVQAMVAPKVVILEQLREWLK